MKLSLFFFVQKRMPPLFMHLCTAPILAPPHNFLSLYASVSLFATFLAPNTASSFHLLECSGKSMQMLRAAMRGAVAKQYDVAAGRAAPSLYHDRSYTAAFLPRFILPSRSFRIFASLTHFPSPHMVVAPWFPFMGGRKPALLGGTIRGLLHHRLLEAATTWYPSSSPSLLVLPSHPCSASPLFFYTLRLPIPLCGRRWCGHHHDCPFQERSALLGARGAPYSLPS